MKTLKLFAKTQISKSLKLSGLLLVSTSLAACSSQLPSLGLDGVSSGINSGLSNSSVFSQNGGKYSSSGTIIISQRVPSRDASTTLAAERNLVMAPLIGYFPPAGSYSPADNEAWLQIERTSKKVTLFKGSNPVRELSAEGVVKLASGEFYLQHKQSEPLWYAPDIYFQKRKLATPKPGARLRYRRGALGKFALYPTTTFPIHCGPVWNADVGGLRLPPQELAAIYEALPVGAAIVVK